LKSFAKMMIAQKGQYLRKSQGMLFESFCFDNSESDDSHSFKYPN